MQIVEIFYSFQCPYSYLAIDRLSALEQNYDIQVLWQPFSSRATGKTFTNTQISPERASYIREDVARLARAMELPLVMPGEWPEGEFDPDRSIRGAVIASDMGVTMEYNIKLFDRWWGQGLDPNDTTFLNELAEDLDVDMHDFASKMSTSDTRERVRGIFRRGKKLGIFDTPTVLIGEERFYGIDRLPFVEERLTEMGLRKKKS